MMSELINILSRLLRFLQSHDVRYAIIVENYLKRLESANTEDEINRILAEARERMLRGMGSLNDVWICNENGHIVDDEKMANSKLELFREELRHVLFNE